MWPAPGSRQQACRSRAASRRRATAAALSCPVTRPSASILGHRCPRARSAAGSSSTGMPSFFRFRDGPGRLVETTTRSGRYFAIASTLGVSSDSFVIGAVADRWSPRRPRRPVPGSDRELACSVAVARAHDPPRPGAALRDGWGATVLPHAADPAATMSAARPRGQVAVSWPCHRRGVAPGCGTCGPDPASIVRGARAASSRPSAGHQVVGNEADVEIHVR